MRYYPDSIKGVSFSPTRFSDNIYASLKDSAIGWAYAIWKNDRVVASKAGGYKIVPGDRKEGVGASFTVNTRMHVASLSKTITALAVAKLVQMGKIGWDSPVRPYLPSDWTLHPSFEKLTVRELITMTSGLDRPLDAASSSYDSLKAILSRSANLEKKGKFNYQNTGYGLFRIIIAYLTGYKEFKGVSADVASVATASHYVKFVNDSILQPAGVRHAQCSVEDADTEPVLRYSFPADGLPGVLSGTAGSASQNGELTTFAGAFGWYLSVDDVGKLLNAVFYKKRILSTKTVQELIAMNFPLRVRNGKYGEYFGTGGDWGGPLKPKGWAGIHAYYYCFPDNTTAIVFVNSGEGAPSGKILRAYHNSFK